MVFNIMMLISLQKNQMQRKVISVKKWLSCSEDMKSSNIKEIKSL